MTAIKRARTGPDRRAQRGLSLITALLFMVAALILGVSVVGINAMQERMIGNAKDRELAMQAAEAALRDAELDISSNLGATSVFSANCSDGLCTPPSQRSAPNPLPVHEQTGFSWADAAKVRLYGQYTAVAAFPKVAQAPAYVIEKLGGMGVAPGESEIDSSGPSRMAYRITARATGAREDTVVVLQSIYAR
jgi:type IV pilus assembly protein PilX